MIGRYAAYKDSGVEWLGEVPEGWEVRSIKSLSPVLRGASPRPIDDPKYFSDEGDYFWVRITDVSASNGTLDEASQKLSDLGSSLSVKLEPGSLFISIAGSVGKPCITNIKACIHDGFVYFPRLKIPPEFLFRVFEAGNCYAGLGKMGTQLNLNTDTIGDIRIALPPPDELVDVLRFLDQQTAKIDALVAQQRRLIDLLREKRQAVISHAVTRGLNPHAPLKPSGIDWLGDVPEGWEVVPFKKVVHYQEGPGIMAIDFREDGIPLMRISGVRDRWATLDGCNYLDPELVTKRWSHFRLELGDLVISASASLGTISEVNEETVGAVPYTGLIRMKPVSGMIRRDFLRSFLSSGFFLTQIDQLKAGAMIQHFGPTHLGQITIAVPPMHVQEQIVTYLDEVTAKLDTLTTTAESAIALLQERRAALISAAVTGKIDVRGAVTLEETTE